MVGAIPAICAENWAFNRVIWRKIAIGQRLFTVIRRVVTGVWQDGFIHAGNLAYMGILALFPFFIVIGAVFSAIGEQGERAASLAVLLMALPPMVADVVRPVANEVMGARHGWLLGLGAAVGLWTVSSLIETIRDILHRAYGVTLGAAQWRYRLLSMAMIMVSVIFLLASLYVQIAITAAQTIMAVHFPLMEQPFFQLVLSRIIPSLILLASIYLVFLALTPGRYRSKAYPKYPGALLVTLWWVGVSMALPAILRSFFHYDLTYGSLAGVMIALFFFWLIGLGIVAGAELNAALAVGDAARDHLGQSDNRARDDMRQQTSLQEGSV
jgi:membrane protein